MTKDMKFDGGKVLAAIPFQDFPLAIRELVQVCTFGAQKYDRSSWSTVPNAEVRYEDALARHFLAQYTENLDQESGLYHKAHLAWNALATLEMELRKLEEGRYTVDDECHNDCCTPAYDEGTDMEFIMTTYGPLYLQRN
jgi:hypothetical protein